MLYTQKPRTSTKSHTGNSTTQKSAIATRTVLLYTMDIKRFHTEITASL